jgi:hypothetical protein
MAVEDQDKLSSSKLDYFEIKTPVYVWAKYIHRCIYMSRREFHIDSQDDGCFIFKLFHMQKQKQ